MRSCNKQTAEALESYRPNSPGDIDTDSSGQRPPRFWANFNKTKQTSGGQKWYPRPMPWVPSSRHLGPPFSQMTAAPLSGRLSFPPPRGKARPTEPPPSRAELRPHSKQTCRTITSEDCNSQTGERMGKKQRPAAEPAHS